MSFQRGSVFDDAEAEFDRLVPCAEEPEKEQ
jgi:hypothetical protein